VKCWSAPAGRPGVARYQVLYDDLKGHRRSASTYATEDAADKAWQRAGLQMAEGRMGNPSRGRHRLHVDKCPAAQHPWRHRDQHRAGDGTGMTAAAVMAASSATQS
jgi:hypothetical protein